MSNKKKIWFNFNLEKWNTLDMGLFKLSLIAFTLFLVSVWPAFTGWAIRTHWVWFLIVFILAAIAPMAKGWKK